MNSLDLGQNLGDGYYDCLAHVLSRGVNGHALEFGVATGKTLRMIADVTTVTGFDSFEGLPEDWRAGFPKGMFAQPVPDVPGAELVVGWFEDTLPKWASENEDKLSSLGLVHIDCDLYSSTKTILDNIGKYLKKNVIVVFDEYHGYPGWYEHEYKAWQEYVSDNGTEYYPIGYGPEQFALVIR